MRWHAGLVRRSRPTALALLAAAVLTALAACSAPAPAVVAPSSVDASATAAPPSVGAVPPGLERFYAQRLSWGPCAAFAGPDDEAAFADKRYECARLKVPLDYAAPTARTAQLGVLRLEASGAKIGSLVVNPGGPGASGMSAVPSLFGSGPGAEGPLTARFDVVGLDPRGVGASTPTIDCLTDAEWEVERGDLDVDPSRPASRRPRTRTASTPSAAPTAWARTSSPTSAPATPPATSTSCAPRSATGS